jgi:hypothetical protein
MSDDQFTKLFKYMQEFRQDVGDRFGEVDKRFDDLTNLIDGPRSVLYGCLTCWTESHV